MKKKSCMWLVIVFLFAMIPSSCSNGGDDAGSEKNKAVKANGAAAKDGSGGLLEIQKKSAKRIKELSDDQNERMKEVQDTQNENRTRDNDN